VLAPSYREYGAMLYRGVDMSEVLLYWGGDERGSDFKGPRSDFPFCVPIATQCLHAAGIPGIQVDGNDVIAVRHWVERALARGRKGDGATLIEAVTYRLSDHTTADDASRYRKKEEVETARNLEPLIRIRRYLTDIGAWNEEKEAELLEQAAIKVDAAVQKYLNTAKAPVESMFDYMYAEVPEFLEEQREHAMRYADTHGGSHG
jgi:pyruvate dehydrogenase E1 component alpha subunit